MNVIGLGQAGCNIADSLSAHPQYKAYKIDVGIEGKRCYDVTAQKGPEEYEQNSPSMKAFFKGVNGETLFIVGGSGHISAMCLRIMEQIKDKCELSVLYVKPDPTLLSKTKKLHEKATFKILQEFARSGLLKMLYIVSNTNLENILGNVPIIGYNNKINELLVSTVHMINVFKNSEPVMGKIENPSDVCRISTFGISEIEKGEEKLFFNLDNTAERCYIYGINEERLATEGGLKKKIIDRIRSSSNEEGLQASFGVFPTNYEQDYCYTLNYTSIIQ